MGQPPLPFSKSVQLQTINPTFLFFFFFPDRQLSYLFYQISSCNPFISFFSYHHDPPAPLLIAGPALAPR